MRISKETLLIARSLASAVFLILAVVSHSAAPAQVQGACASCGDRHRVRCGRCAGEGTREVACPSCDGSGRNACRVCSRSRGKGAPPPGRLICGNGRCRKGKLRVRGSRKTSCRVCSGRGHFDCPECKGGKSDCPCRGRRVVRVCGDCAGAGTLACPECRLKPSLLTCQLCGGDKQHRCRQCLLETRKVKCWTCAGRGGDLCKTCRGAGRTACGGCSGAGKTYMPSRRGSSRLITRVCSTCRGKGFTACDDCVKGLRSCPDCTKGIRKKSCGYCHNGKVTCGGCRRGMAAGFERLAQALVDGERYAQALAWYDAAMCAAQAVVKKARKELEDLNVQERQLPAIKRPLDRLRARQRVLQRRAGLQGEIARNQAIIRLLQTDRAEVAAWVADP